MRAARAARLARLPTLAIVALALAAGPAARPAGAQPAPERRAILVLLPGVSYEDALANPVFAALGRLGGIGLMTTAGANDSANAGYVTLGAGAVAGGPRGRVKPIRSGSVLDIDVDPFRQESPNAEPGRLGTALGRAGRSVQYVLVGEPVDDPGILIAMDSEGRAQTAAADPDLVVIDPGRYPVSPGDIGPFIEVLLASLRVEGAEETLVVATSAGPSPAMESRGDQVAPIAMATTNAEDLTAALERTDPPAAGLTSATTGHEGVIANVDVAPTILRFLGRKVPATMTGSLIEVTGDPPTALHERYLEYARAVTPVGLVVLGVALSSLVAALVLLLWFRYAPGWITVAVAVWGLVGVGMQVALLPASLLPTFDLPVALAAVAALGAAIAGVALAFGRGSPAFTPPAIVAGTGLALVVLDAALGWPSLLTPLVGGSALDGVRFYGLGNTYAGVVLAGAVLLAALFPAAWGALVIVAAAMFAGLPWTGADFGGGETLSAVAGLWVALRLRDRLGRARLPIAVGAFLLGLAVLVVSHRLALEPTHVTRAVEGPGGLLGALGIFVRRLLLNLEVTAATPSVWPVLVGLPVWLVVALRSPGPFREPFERSPAWRDAALTLAAGGMIGYVLNDTYGMAAITFLYVSLAVVFPALRLRWTNA